MSNECISLLINHGNQYNWSFPEPPDTLFDQFGDYLTAYSMAAADIDGDGDYDLFGDSYIPGELRYYENVGTPQDPEYHFITANWQGISASELNADPCFRDLDADGDLDLLLGTMQGNIHYYINDGTYINPNLVLVTENFEEIDVGWHASPELVDIDADGDLDLFVGRGYGIQEPAVENGNISFYENIGTPQIAEFTLRTHNYLIFDAGKNSRPVLVDIDADGDRDLFTQIDDKLACYENNGSSTNPYFSYITSNFCDLEVNDIIPWFFDLDNDGDYDLVAGEGAIPGPPGLHLFINRGSAQLPDYVLYSDDLVPGVFTQSSVILNLSMADIDADGDDDLFVSTGEATIYYFENNSTPTQIQFDFITANWQGIVDPGTYGTHMYSCFYDIDNDSDLDLFLSNYIFEIMFYRNIGDSLNADMQLEIESLIPDLLIRQASPFLCDIDSDGDGDMLVGDGWGGIRYFKNTTGDTSAVEPRLSLDPHHGIQFSIGPNPANPITWISYNLPYPQKAEIAVYNLLGQKVAILASGLQMPGQQTLIWDAANYSSGQYFIKLETEMGVTSDRVVLVK
ncbi:T9SS type A sorting domain-containing protein [bacterium]|nr:T9SS type A sorting domain-containing protein [bacterium]